MQKDKSICVIIPALNEENSIGSTIKAMPAFVDKVIVIDDGSTDKTVEISKQSGAEVISHNRNMGVGAAFQTAVRAVLNSNYDIMVNIDADGQFDPKDIEKITEPIISDKADFATASRFKDPELYPKMSKVKFIGNKMMSRFISVITQQKFYDVSCGFRAYSRETLMRMNLFGEFTYTQESFIDLVFKNLRISEIPVKVRGTREHGKSRIASNLFNYGLQTLKIIVRTYRDHKPFKFFALIGFLLFLVAFGLFIFLMIHYLQAGEFTPYKFVGFTSAFFFVLSLVFFLIGFILDMFSRMRKNQEQILYHLKKNKNE